MKRFLKKMRNFLLLQKNKLRDRRTHVYRECPFCHAVLRLPKRPGAHSVKCPRCSEHFDVTVK